MFLYDSLGMRLCIHSWFHSHVLVWQPGNETALRMHTLNLHCTHKSLTYGGKAWNEANEQQPHSQTFPPPIFDHLQYAKMAGKPSIYPTTCEQVTSPRLTLACGYYVLSNCQLWVVKNIRLFQGCDVVLVTPRCRDVAMLLRDPYALNAICSSIVKCLLQLSEHSKLPRVRAV